MKLLIDECLHTSLVEVAHAAGHAADHVKLSGVGRVQRLGARLEAAGCGGFVQEETAFHRFSWIPVSATAGLQLMIPLPG